MRWGHYFQPTFRLLILLLGLSVCHVSLADELRPAFLQLTQISADTIKVDWKYKKWLFGPRLSYIMTNNYNWWLQQANDIYFVNGKDVQQFAVQFNFQYQL